MSSAEEKEKKPESSSTAAPTSTSYLAAAVGSMSPWGGSRKVTPKPTEQAEEALGLKNQNGGDHSVNTWHGIPLRRYPDDCPPLNARWFHAVDTPKRRPNYLKDEAAKDSKPLPPPKKFQAFSPRDSKAIETAFLRMVDEADIEVESGSTNTKRKRANTPPDTQPNTSLNDGLDEDKESRVKVPVNEDYLFDVDVANRELAPVYWLGPIYEVKRGSWFFQDGAALKPCEENLAAQLEEGYLKIKPFRFPKAADKSIRATKAEEDAKVASSSKSETNSAQVTPRASVVDLRAKSEVDNAAQPSPPPPPQAYRLFGQYMNSTVTYQDNTVAWLSNDTIMSRVSNTVFQRFSGSAYGGVKVIRGYVEPSKPKETKAEKPMPSSAVPENAEKEPGLQPDERQQKLLKRRSAPPRATFTADTEAEKEKDKVDKMATEEAALERLLGVKSPGADTETADKQEEKEIQDDYNGEDEDPSREIEHLLLVTHGIGQKLSMRTESVNFIHDVNVLRKTLKSVYATSADLQALNSEIDKLPRNCRVQVLPVCWRHLLDFPKQGLRKNRREHDIGEAIDEQDYPSLEDITVEGVPFVRSLITDLALDILLYQSGYREHIASIVLNECNRIYSLFLQRNPYFKGKVSLVGHSLGSAIFFDMLCRQKEAQPQPPPPQRSFFRSSSGSKEKERMERERREKERREARQLSFEFSVEDFYALGSPIALFQMLKGRTIAARHLPQSMPTESPLNPDYMDDPFLTSTSDLPYDPNMAWAISSPKCSQLYNIFHPSDPISYRIEPLISPAMSTLKPQPLPYTKKGIFGTSASQGLTGIGAKVGQSVSGLWSSLSSGIATSLLNRSLGLTGEDVAKLNKNIQESQLATASNPSTAGAGGNGPDVPSLARSDTDDRKKQLAADTAAADRAGNAAAAPTLIDDEMETLWAGFQKAISQETGEGADEQTRSNAEEKGRSLRREEMKVRALNRNGRVDYSIQESILDYNPINTIASHMSYWGDEDVSHFMLSQMLSRSRKMSVVTPGVEHLRDPRGF